MPIVVTKLTAEEVKELEQHSEELISFYAGKWLEHYVAIEEAVRERTNILSLTAKLLTVDSQLTYMVEVWRKQNEEDMA